MEAKQKTLLVFGHENEICKMLVQVLAQDFGLQVKAADELDFITQLNHVRPALVIQAKQTDLALARICIEHKIHYLDLTSTEIEKIADLNTLACAQSVVVVSGVAVFPALSSVIVDAFCSRFATLREVELGISYGDPLTYAPGTLKNLLTHLGKPFLRLEQGQWQTVYGAQNLHRHYYGDNIGFRWHSNLPVPDLTLFPARYPSLETMRFYVGRHLSWLEVGLWSISWLVRVKLLNKISYVHKPLHFISKLLSKQNLQGGMVVRLYGTDHRYQPLEIKWLLVAEQGSCAFLNIVPALILIKKILADEIAPGSRPCLGMFSLAEVDALLASHAIYHTQEETHY